MRGMGVPGADALSQLLGRVSSANVRVGLSLRLLNMCEVGHLAGRAGTAPLEVWRCIWPQTGVTWLVAQPGLTVTRRTHASWRMDARNMDARMRTLPVVAASKQVLRNVQG